MGRWVRQRVPTHLPQGPAPPHPTPSTLPRIRLPAPPTFLNHGGDPCDPPCVFGGLKKCGSLGLPARLASPNPLDQVAARMMTVRSA